MDRADAAADAGVGGAVPPARLCDGGEVPYLGERLVLRVRTEALRRRAHVSRRGSELRVALGPDSR